MTDQPLNRVDGAPLRDLQRRRKLVLLLGIALAIAPLVVTESSWRGTAPGVHWLIAVVGLILIVLCILGRTWCTLYIGGHKKRRLVVYGPYSVVRNPLYDFTIVGAAGIGALSGSILVAVLFAAFAFAVFLHVVRQEEAFLAAQFGAEFAAYAARVGRFWPRISRWQEPDELIVNPRLVRRTFLDASLFLLAVPLMALKDLLQQLGAVPVLLHLP
jgi:protein-S-isoprenylcysteine O-methyltransferase Ste14